MAPLGGKTGAVVGSAAMHAAALVLVAFGHAPSGGRALSTTRDDAELVEIEPTPALDDAPEPVVAKGGGGPGAPATPTHTHPYPVPFDHDAHPHDPHLVHVAAAPVAAAAVENPYEVSEAAPSAPSAPSAPPPRFHLVVSAGGGAGTGTGTWGGVGAGAEGNAIVPASRVSVAARPIVTVVPAYPVGARAQGLEGRVLIEIVVDTSGAVLEARVARGAGHGFDEAALVAIRAFRFSPAQVEGRPVRVRMLWPVAFELE